MGHVFHDGRQSENGLGVGPKHLGNRKGLWKARGTDASKRDFCPEYALKIVMNTWSNYAFMIILSHASKKGNFP